MRQQRYLSVLVLFYFVLFFFATSIRAQEVEDEREFDYAVKSEKGPRMWGKMKKEWEACNSGEMQSPIDLSNERVRIIRKPEKRNYKLCNATVKNRGHDISLQWHGDAGSVLINGTEYPLQQAHWHSPSEHTVNGRRYAMEMHMVHLNQNATNKIAVIGVLYKFGKPDKFLSKLIRNISSMIDKKDDVKNAGMINPREIKIGSRKYYRYLGSLTVPPCTEGVIWSIKKKVRTISRDQVKLLREAVHDYAASNARPMQPLNKRPVYLMAPGATA
ncbi:PREDICTED: alpha carbonic anhydrase 7-like [Nicotiana attenuata]|uniref:Carbonic anhydrase n=1 Tax=Nicotiana attenuata TaxID=49451 RepID=A0A314L0K8_NICAT|nr:PREDICTED: alpha carbonic anhydrase 7-like [Nicotiana attenuata]OIT35140.1 alpha carbonic anhydrase 7 [Nicotiana attenuata]